MALSKAKEIVTQNPLVVFSKTHCPYCNQVKTLLSSIGTKPKVVELDKEADGPAIQSALAEWTGQRTVPSVFVGGKYVGGCDGMSALFENVAKIQFQLPDTTKKHNNGQLLPMLKDAGAIS